MIKRLSDLRVGGKQLRLPIYFPSISSVKTAITPLEYLLVLCALKTEHFLVSSFDLHYTDPETQEQFKKKLSEAKNNGLTVLLDSGNYESYWREKRDSWSQQDFHQVLANFEFTMAFGFDEQSPPADFMAHVRLVCERHKHDQSVNLQVPVIPIVHGNPDDLPGLCAKIVDLAAVPIIAVPERRLGEGIFARAKCISEIRKAMNSSGKYVGLHLLGTGNPISIAIYTIAGADSFDGLEWCQTVVDHETGLLFHSAQADFFQNQTAWGDSEIGFQPRMLAHNLEFYKQWMERLCTSVHDDRGIEFCRTHFPIRFFSGCAETFGWK